MSETNETTTNSSASARSIPPPARPYMPNYGIHTEADGMLTWEWVENQMAASRNYWICSTRPDGKPHASPVWGIWVDGALYFGADRQSRKAKNLTHSPFVIVHLESGDDTVIFEGTVEEVTDRAIHARLAAAYAQKYPMFTPDPEPPPTQITFVLKPKTVFAWLETSFPKTATRWTFPSE